MMTVLRTKTVQNSANLGYVLVVRETCQILSVRFHTHRYRPSWTPWTLPQGTRKMFIFSEVSDVLLLT